MLISLMTRIPIPGFTKTRLESHFTKQECAKLHCAFILDMISMLTIGKLEYKLFYEPQGDINILKKLLPKEKQFIPQEGINLGEKMFNALKYAFDNGYQKAGVLGTDLPHLGFKTLKIAEDALNSHDIVIGPTADGGYYFLGMKEPYQEIFDIPKWGTDTVLESTIKVINQLNLKLYLLPEYHDLDYFEDIVQLYHSQVVPFNTLNLLKKLDINSRLGYF